MLDSRLEEQDQEGGEEKMEEHVDTDEARKQRKQERKKIRKEERARRKEEEAERERLERRQLKAEARAKAKEEKRLFAMRKREEAAEKMAAAQKLEEEARMMQWSIWVHAQCEDAAGQLMFATLMRNKEKQAARAKPLVARLQRPLAALNTWLGSHKYMLGDDRWTIADLNVASVLDSASEFFSRERSGAEGPSFVAP